MTNNNKMIIMTKIYENLYASNPWLHLYAARISRIKSSNEYENKDFDTGYQVEKGKLERVVDNDARKITGIEPVLSSESAQAYLEERHYLSGQSSLRVSTTLRELMDASKAYRKR